MNTAKNHLTVQSRKITKSDYDVTDIEQIEGNMSLTEQTTPENLLHKDELQETVLKTIENLPEDLKSAIMLREIDGLSYEDIANVMDCPVGTVRSRIFRAREMIDNKIKPLLEN